MLEGAPSAPHDDSEVETTEKPLTTDEKLEKLFPRPAGGTETVIDSHGVVHTVSNDQEAIDVHKEDLAA